jgi:hypothetical protein
MSTEKYPVVRPSWSLKPGLTDRLVVGRKVNLTLSSGSFVFYLEAARPEPYRHTTLLYLGFCSRLHFGD